MKRRSPNKNKIILGLTGSFGSGKTTVARIFKSKGAKIIDADRIAHSIIRPKGEIYKKLVYLFGRDILGRNASIDRAKLAEAVFNKKSLLNKLNSIMHPRVIEIIKNEIKKSPGGVIVLDAPLLIETGLQKITDKLVVVKINQQNQIKRLLCRTRLSRQGILKRINAQMPLSAKIRLADFVIDNNKAINDTRKQVKELWSRLTTGRKVSGKVRY